MGFPFYHIQKYQKGLVHSEIHWHYLKINILAVETEKYKSLWKKNSYNLKNIKKLEQPYVILRNGSSILTY